MSNPAGEGDLLRSGWQARSKQEKVGARDKMQPSLLDRLTDNDPEKKTRVGQQQSDHSRRPAPQCAARSAVAV